MSTTGSATTSTTGSATGTVEYNQYWSLENDVAGGFNRLKAKLFNLIEATIVDKTQMDAVKGLIKGFANDEYKLCTQNMRYTAQAAGYLDPRSGQSIEELTAEPLENRVF